MKKDISKSPRIGRKLAPKVKKSNKKPIKSKKSLGNTNPWDTRIPNIQDIAGHGLLGGLFKPPTVGASLDTKFMELTRRIFVLEHQINFLMKHRGDEA